MPTLPEFLSQLQFITQETALLGLFITAGIIFVGRDWRGLILALLAQYILAGLILSRLVRPDIATLQVMIGAFICPILFMSARRVSVSSVSITNYSHALGQAQLARWWQLLLSLIRGRDLRRRSPATGFMFRVFALLLMILVATTLSNSVVLPGLSSSVNTAVYWLILAGLVTMVLTEDPIKVGHGLFTTLTGFELFYATVEKSLLLIGLWGTVNLLIALAIGYLTVIKGTSLEEGS